MSRRERADLRADLLTDSIDALARGHDLSFDESAAVLGEIMAGRGDRGPDRGLLIALRTKGETVQEIAGLARAMRISRPASTSPAMAARHLAAPAAGARTFNVSTTAALIAAGAGLRVAKHGNRSATGLSGSADLLEAMGARIDLAPAAVARCIEDVGFGFMFAPAHHQATRYVVPSAGSSACARSSTSSGR